MQGKLIQDSKLFQYRFPELLWENIGVFVRNLSSLRVWVNRELASTVFGGRQNYEYWKIVVETGETPQGYTVLAAPLDLMEIVYSPERGEGAFQALRVV